MGRWLIALTAAALIVVPSATPQLQSASTVVRVVSLGSNASKSAAVRCPSGTVAVSGGLQSPGSGTSTFAIRPSGSSAFSFRLGNPEGNPRQRVALAVACRSPSARAKYKVAHVSRQISVRPGTQKRVSLSCPGGTLAAGAGFDLAPRGGKQISLQLRRQTQTLNGRSFLIRNDATTARPAVLYATCLTLVVPSGAPRVRLQVSVTTATMPVRPGTQVLKQHCPRGWFSLATGYALRAPLRVAGSAAVSGGGRWSLTNSGSGPVLAELQLTCGRVA